jgi:hypothetical protein
MQTYFPILPIVLIIRIVLTVIQEQKKANSRNNHHRQNVNSKPVKRRYKMKLNFTRRIKNVQPLFSGHYIDAKALYVLYFDKIPCVCFIGSIDANAACDYIREGLSNEVIAVYQHTYFDHDKQEILFNNTLFVLTNNRIIEVAIGYVHVMYEPNRLSEVTELMKALAEFKTVAAIPTYQTKVVGFARESEMN